MTSVAVIREFNIPRRRRPRKSPLKSELAFFQSLSWLFQLTYFAKCKRTLLELNSQQPYPSSESERKFGHRSFTSSTKREIRYFHAVVLQWRQRNVQDRVINASEESLLCLFNPLPFWTFTLPSPSPSPPCHLKLPIMAVVSDAYFITPLLCFKMEGLNFNFSLLLYRVFESAFRLTAWFLYTKAQEFSSKDSFFELGLVGSDLDSGFFHKISLGTHHNYFQQNHWIIPNA